MATCIAPQAFETIQMELQSSSENVGKVMLDVYFVGEDGQTKVDPSDPHSSMVATHRSLKRALDNHRSLLKIHESSSCELLNDTAKHYLIKWQIESVILNTCVTSYGEATSATLKNQISSDNPAIIAANRAQDRAIISLLGLITDKPVYSDSEISVDPAPKAPAPKDWSARSPQPTAPAYNPVKSAPRAYHPPVAAPAPAAVPAPSVDPVSAPYDEQKFQQEMAVTFALQNSVLHGQPISDVISVLQTGSISDKKVVSEQVNMLLNITPKYDAIEKTQNALLYTLNCMNMLQVDGKGKRWVVLNR